MPQTDLPKAYSNFKKHGNFDAIHVGAAVRFPEEVVMLLDLLKPGGAMVVPQYENEGQSDSQVITFQLIVNKGDCRLSWLHFYSPTAFNCVCHHIKTTALLSFNGSTVEWVDALACSQDNRAEQRKSDTSFL